jgi:UDP-glucose 4-epimerase
MKVLITGENSYLGQSFYKWAKTNKSPLNLEFISLKGSEWKKTNFSVYDSVIHLAALVHQNESKVSYEEYKRINVDLTNSLADLVIKAKVKQFIFLSTMAVFGNASRIREKTIMNPITKYGKTKLEAEEELLKLFKNQFTKLAIVRPPMIYGQNAKGNPALFEKVAKALPFFIDNYNKRSFLFIDNFSIFLNQLIDNSSSGIFHPSDPFKSSTFELMAIYRKAHNKNLFKIPFLGHILNVLLWIPFIKKVFGNLYYDFKADQFSKLPKFLDKKAVINSLKT